MVIPKKGWIRVVEVFVAILLIIGFLLILLNKGYLKEDISSKIYEAEVSILRGVQLDLELRRNILISNRSGYPGTEESPLPIEWEEFEDNEQRRLESVKEKINDQVPNYLECIARICELSDDCILNVFIDKDIYAKPSIIVADYEVWAPRQLKLFCWVK
jgi:hypothetical protein